MKDQRDNGDGHQHLQQGAAFNTVIRQKWDG
jgi:hypothetical protein